MRHIRRAEGPLFHQCVKLFLVHAYSPIMGSGIRENTDHTILGTSACVRKSELWSKWAFGNLAWNFHRATWQYYARSQHSVACACVAVAVKLTSELDREVDGRRITEVSELHALLYGDSAQAASVLGLRRRRAVCSPR